MIWSCKFCSASEYWPRTRREYSSLAYSHTIQRYAFDNNGDVGSLYDACKDRIISNLNINESAIIKNPIDKLPTCDLIEADVSVSDKLLQSMPVADDLRLSVALEIMPSTEEAAMLCNYESPDDRNTRFIHYRRFNYEKRLNENVGFAKDALPTSLTDTEATHIITSVKEGIDFIIALELPSNENHSRIDSILSKLRKCFLHSEADFLSLEEQHIINNLKPKIFTQIITFGVFTKTDNLSDICLKVREHIFKRNDKVPLIYTMHSVKCIYPDDLSKNRIFYSLDTGSVMTIRQNMLPLYNKLTKIKRLFHENMSSSFAQNVKSRIEETSEELSRVDIMYKELKERIVSAIIHLRQIRCNSSLLDNDLNGHQFNLLHSKVKVLCETLEDFQAKAGFIKDLLGTNKRVEYLDIADLAETGDNQQLIERKLSRHNPQQNKYFICSTGKLIKKSLKIHNKLCEQFFKEHESTSSLCLVFADFSYCSFELSGVNLIPSIPKPSILTSVRLPSTSMQSDEINVLLIGETGVGKSTFINAFVNYLAFHSMQQATNGEPIVLIPVSFLITIGDNFEEKPIKFGQFDANEDHNHSGQSVTQHCKSYTFTIKNNIKLRIIDTPGVGDTRGAEQDNQNIDDILSYTSNLSHLNAICFLLKPNTTRLNILFRSCFMQLFNFLGPNACKNIIFCFTNTRATFYAPGDTAKLLKTMLNDLPNNHKPSFTKENTFCFDSESFRYLTVIKNGYTLAFDEKQKLDFEKSWQMSVAESIRLLKFVESRSQYVMNEWHSMKHAQMMIKLLARPILETICNALRNLILWKLNHKRRIIEFKPQSISLPTWLCTDCSYEIKQIDNISIVTHPVRNNRTSNRYCTCRCTSYEHLPIFYELQYQLGSTKGIKFSEETEKIKDRLLDGSVILSQFLLYTTDTSENPFLFWLDLLIKEQAYLSSKEPSSTPNIKLYDEKKKYLDKLKDIKRDDERIKLDAVYKCIEEIFAYPQIIIQINATKESQMKMMKNNECDVSSQYPHMNKFL